MRYSLRLEVFADDLASTGLLADRQLRAMGISDGVRDLLRVPSFRPWVARLVGLDPRYGFRREFLRANRDYREANSLGSRGVYDYYLLDEGQPYEIFERLSWSRTDRYFARVTDGRLERISREEVERCLSASADSASTS